VDLLDQADWIGMPAIVLGELRVGFLLGRHATANEADLREFLSTSPVEVVDVDQDVARHYSEIFIDLRRAGRPIQTNDIWIAAVAAREGAILLSYDNDFNAISRVGSIIFSP
jgi:tRNA(fMet)-specific endonuclease VapC